MVNIPGAPDRIAIAHAHNPTLPIGLHLNLTVGRPVLPAARVPHLVGPDGGFLPHEAILPCLSEIPLEEIRAEVAAQAELLVRCGVPFDHIDYHHHILALNSPLFEVVAELASAYRVPVRQPIIKIIPGRPKVGRLDNKSGKMVKGMAAAFRQNPRRMLYFLSLFSSYPTLNMAAAKLGAPDWFIGAFFNNPTLANFKAILRQLPPGLSELVAHPAIEADELYTMEEEYRAERPRELAVLLDPRARVELDRLAIRLTDFSSACCPVSPA
jgi:predicted glycoside hydrolase/deacetylase ChbG (UPF0249 family)